MNPLLCIKHFNVWCANNLNPTKNPSGVYFTLLSLVQVWQWTYLDCGGLIVIAGQQFRLLLWLMQGHRFWYLPAISEYSVSYLPCLLNTDARLFMLVSVSGCSFPSTLSLSASACRCIRSASSYLPCLLNTTARLFMLPSVSGCSFPSTLSVSASSCRCISSVSSYLPWLLNTSALGSVIYVIDLSRQGWNHGSTQRKCTRSL